jgi:hypothetical protein
VPILVSSSFGLSVGGGKAIFVPRFDVERAT